MTCLTPTLVGDGRKLAPIDYMVWRDQVNVLDQTRIFRLLARGPRLDGYLAQLKKADKLDFASWGGFAQNYSERRIPFEHASMTPVWNAARAEGLFIPLFAAGLGGAYLPASALKGALRTAVMYTRVSEQMLKQVAARVEQDGRVSRQASQALEDNALGAGGADEMRTLAAADSAAIANEAFKVYLLRVSTLEARQGGKYELAWKQSPRGSVRRAEDSTPLFAEMAQPGTVFEGEWRELEFLRRRDTARALRRRERPDTAGLLRPANAYTANVIDLHRRYAESTGLAELRAGLEQLRGAVEEAQAGENCCVLPLGWGAGFLSKAAFLNTEDPAYRQILRAVPFYARAIQSGLPFPKTRRVVFLNGRPAALPGFVRVEVS